MSNDIDYKIESLLTKHNKGKYDKFKEETDNSSTSKDLFKSNIGSKIKNSKCLYNKLKYFSKLYFQQN